jgi:hypothetical protein
MNTSHALGRKIRNEYEPAAAAVASPERTMLLLSPCLSAPLPPCPRAVAAAAVRGYLEIGVAGERKRISMRWRMDAEERE